MLVSSGYTQFWRLILCTLCYESTIRLYMISEGMQKVKYLSIEKMVEIYHWLASTDQL